MTLEDVAEVRMGGDPPSAEPPSVEHAAVVLKVQKQPRPTRSSVTGALDPALDDIARSLPPGCRSTARVSPG